MDIATLVGILLGLGFTVGGIAMAAIAAGASAMVFVSVSSFVIVFGGFGSKYEIEVGKLRSEHKIKYFTNLFQYIFNKIIAAYCHVIIKLRT